MLVVLFSAKKFDLAGMLPSYASRYRVSTPNRPGTISKRLFDLNSGFYGAASCKTGAGGTGVAMVGSCYQASRIRGRLHLRDMYFTPPQVKTPGKIKITIV